MKIAVFSDIHGNYQALDAIMNRIEKDNYDRVIYLGDAVALGPDSDLCMERLNNSKVEFILGNHELYVTRGHEIDPDMDEREIKHNDWVTKSLKKSKINDNNNLKIELELNGKKFCFKHFLLDEKNKYPFKHLDMFQTDAYKEEFNKEKYDYIFYGHLHEERYDRLNGKEFYGIGSSGCRHNSKTYFYSIETDKNKIKINKVKLSYNRKRFLNRMKTVRYYDKKILGEIFFGIY
jgi:predicted phosphodiesterase